MFLTKCVSSNIYLTWWHHLLWRSRHHHLSQRFICFLPVSVCRPERTQGKHLFYLSPELWCHTFLIQSSAFRHVNSTCHTRDIILTLVRLLAEWWGTLSQVQSLPSWLCQPGSWSASSPWWHITWTWHREGGQCWPSISESRWLFRPRWRGHGNMVRDSWSLAWRHFADT